MRLCVSNLHDAQMHDGESTCYGHLIQLHIYRVVGYYIATD